MKFSALKMNIKRQRGLFKDILLEIEKSFITKAMVYSVKTYTKYLRG